MHGAWRDALQAFKQSVRAANRHRLYKRRMKKGVDYISWIANNDTPTEQDRASWAAWLRSSTKGPTVSLILHAGNQSTPDALECTIASVREQVCPQWQLLVTVPQHAPATMVARLSTLARDEPRIEVIIASQEDATPAQRAQNALLQANGKWVCQLQVGDQWREHSLLRLLQTAQTHPDAQIIYPDEDRMDSQGRRSAHHFKPDWNLDFLLSANYIGHACLISREHLIAAGGYQHQAGSAYTFDSLLRCMEGLQPEQIVHVTEVLWHQPASSPRPLEETSVQALQSYLDRTAPGALAAPLTNSATRGLLQVRYPVPTPAPLVSIVICTRNQYTLLQTCIESITRRTRYPHYNIIIVDNGSDEARTMAYLERLPRQDPRVRVIRDDSPFNYAALNNMAVAHAPGELVALLNNDIEVIDGDWLEEMVGHALRPDVGCVGAKLLYPDETVQHAGVLVGGGKDAPSTVAAHYLRGIPGEAPGYANRAIVTHQLTAVTAACLVIRKATFLQVGGLDGEHLAVTYNDVDFCLRVGELGLRHVWTPHARLYHHESVSRGRDASSKNLARFLPELAYMEKRWAARLQGDPCYNPNLSYQKPDFLLAEHRETP
jgi:GT2 family glycosyltransferase